MGPNEIEIEDGIDLCPTCSEELEPADLALDHEFYTCDVCQYDMDFGDPACFKCHKDYPFDFWESVLAMFIQAITGDFNHAVIDASEAYFVTICCNESPEFCECENPLDWNDANLVPKHVDEQAYEYTSDCSSCRYWYTAQCLPLRSWMKVFLQTGEISPPIDFCSFYETHKDLAPRDFSPASFH